MKQVALCGRTAPSDPDSLPLQKYCFETQGLAAESHMSSICMGEIAPKWVTHDSFALRLDSCDGPNRYWTNMICPRTERAFKAFSNVESLT